MTRNLALIPNADILIVDDTPNDLRLLGQILGKRYTARLASNGQVALAAAFSAPPDLILLDVMMPEMDGYEVASQLKAREQTKAVPIIFISALDDTDSQVHAFVAGGVDYVTKPFHEKEVLARVETHLALRSLTKQTRAEIAVREQAEENIQRMVERWAIVYRAGEEIGASLDTEQVFAAVHHAMEQVMPCEDFVISLYDEIRNEMMGSYILENGKRIAPNPYKADHGLGGHIVHSGKSLILNSPEQIKASGIRFEPYGKGPITSSVLAVPMQIKGKTIGMLSVQSYHPEAYTTEDQELLEMFAGHVAIAIDHARVFEQAQQEIAARKCIEEALRASNAKLEILFRVSPLAIIMLDADGIVQFWNTAAEQIFGWSSQEAVGQPIPIIPKDRQNEYGDWGTRLFEGKPIINHETVRQRKDGSLVDVSISIAPVFDSAGAAVGRMAILTDVTERKRAEDALRASTAKLEILFQVSPLAITLLDTNGNVLLWNIAAEQIFGYTSQEVLGRPNPIVPVDKQNEYTAWSAQILHGRPISNQETIRQRKDGSFVNVSISSAPVYDAVGNAIGRMAILADITERKQAEESLLLRNQEMATLYETSLEINTLSDVSALLLAIVRRACALLKIPSGALYLVSPDEEALELVVGYQLPPHWVGIKIHIGEGLAGRVVQTKKPMVVEDYLAWGGQLEAFSDSPARRTLGVPLKIHDQITGVIVLIDKQVGTFSEDEIRLASLFADQAAIAVTNAQFAAQLEERVSQRTSELEAANRELENLSYNIAHDMRSPLRAMVGYSSMLQQTHRAQLDSEGLQLLDNIQASGVRLGQMIDGFLTFLHLGHATIHLQPVNTNSLVSRLINKLKPEQEKRQIEFNVGNLPECQADPKLLEQVWAQLISNALKFTRPRNIARIEIGSGEVDGKQYYFVRDNGVGFDMKYSAKLFGIFQKLHYESEFEGTGIGLAIIKRILQRHGGKIWVEAEVDKGAVFYFTLAD